MKKSVFIICLFLANVLYSQNNQSITLNKPSSDRGMSVIKALAERYSAREFDSKPLTLQDMSDLLWAANGVNRQESGKRTAPSAINAQDIDVYLFDNNGVYLYNAQKHTLELVILGDNRKVISNQDKDPYPSVILLLVSDLSRFRRGEDSVKAEWGAMDASFVAQNVLLFCTSVGMEARPRAIMNKDKIIETLKLNSTQIPMLNIPVSYKKNIE